MGAECGECAVYGGGGAAVVTFVSRRTAAHNHFAHWTHRRPLADWRQAVNKSPAEAARVGYRTRDQDQGLSDGTYVDQARQLYVNTTRRDEARTLIANADRQHALLPDEVKAQIAWIDLAESHALWADDNEPGAREWRDRDVAAANTLRAKWPDNAYVLGQVTVSPTGGVEATHVLRVEVDGRRLLVSNYSEEQLIMTEKAWCIAGVTTFLLGSLVLAWSYYQRYHIITVPGTLL